MKWNYIMASRLEIPHEKPFNDDDEGWGNVPWMTSTLVYYEITIASTGKIYRLNVTRI